MIQINLIPDVKQEFIRAQKMRNAVITFAILICGVAMALLAVLGIVYGGQAVRESLARTEINKQYKELQSVENIDDVLTIFPPPVLSISAITYLFIKNIPV